MSEDLFPSGPWVGFYNYGPGDRHRMDLYLTFANGTISGDGNDDVGRFLIGGGYDAATLECQWAKTYPVSHDVAYRGFREGKGIWGTWALKAGGHGGFHIWPKAEGEGESHAASVQVSNTVLIGCADADGGSEFQSGHGGKNDGRARFHLGDRPDHRPGRVLPTAIQPHLRPNLISAFSCPKDEVHLCGLLIVTGAVILAWA